MSDSDSEFKLKNPPIVEVVLDIDCDFPPSFDLTEVEGSLRDALRETYPKLHQQLMQEHRIEATETEAKHAVRHTRQALQFLTADEKQLVQARIGGFSFNRLTPYTGLDDYMAEIERTWSIFVGLAKPVAIRRVSLRTINRLVLPIEENERVNLGRYIKNAPKLPDEDGMDGTGFLTQYSAVEKGSQNGLTVVLTTQPVEGKGFPIIFDIDVSVEEVSLDEPSDWLGITKIIKSLRSLKNRVFKNTLTQECLSLYQ